MKNFKNYIKNFLRYRDLLFELAKNQVILRYRRSYLGLLWSLLNPLLTMLVLTVVFSKLFKQNVANYPVYLMSGRLIFEFNSECTGHALETIVQNHSLIRKIYLPKYVFPLSDAISSLVNLFFSILALVFVMIFTHAPFHLTMLLLWLPIAYLFLFSTGLSLILSTLYVFFRDMKYIYSVLLVIWMYLTPLFYPPEILPEWVLLIERWNPMYEYVEMFRNLIFYGKLPTLFNQVYCVFAGFAMLAFGVWVFKKNQDKFILFI